MTDKHHPLKELAAFELVLIGMFGLFFTGMLLTREYSWTESLSMSLRLAAATGSLLLLILLFFGIQLVRHRFDRPRQWQMLFRGKTAHQLDYMDIVLYLISLAMFIFVAYMIDGFML